MTSAQTMFEKIWQQHVIAEEEDEALLYVDRCLIHEGSRHTFDQMDEEGRSPVEPDKVFAFSDHYAQTTGRDQGLGAISDPKIRGMIELLTKNTKKHGIRHFDIGDPDQGILHVVGPEQGITIPGILLIGADSHTATHGALGNLSFGAGSSEVYHVVVTQTLWQRKPRSMRITIDGTLPFGVASKDLILAIIAKIGHGGAAGHVIEYAGSAVDAMTIEQRMTVCNMSIEAGGRAGMMAPDDKVLDYVHGRPYTPAGADWDQAVEYWRTLPTDDGALFDTEVSLNASELTPMVTWGTNPEHTLPITGRAPSPEDAGTEADKREIAAALEYMDIKPGMPLDKIAVNRVFIGSCTNGRIEDLRAAAEVAGLGKAKVPAWIVPGSGAVKRQAEAEGLDKVFTAAGFEWRDPGCSLCTAINGDILQPGERCASTSNRNFKGRQGLGSRTHLVSPAMAAAAAITGTLTDVRNLAKGS
ncbi:MAG: 3-isopropylmalate dehydratase large subunit [Alphaproteobacteria bacterium]|nr:3-isopropylmalate dehydratase large subunit [Alphaproteobacteria bacterium]